MEWDRDARTRLEEVPLVLRGFVAKKVEEVARKRGKDRVSLDVWQEAKALRGSGAATTDRGTAQVVTPSGIADSSLSAELPPADVLAALVREAETRGQRDGKSYRLRLCGGAFGCPRPQIDVAGLGQDLERALSESGHARRLEETHGDRILTHHKLAVAVAGCVNGCSEPQTKDFAVLGQARPDAVTGKCTGCRRCEKACQEGAVRAGAPRGESPDPVFDRDACLNCGDCARACTAGAISLTPGYRVIAGGKLGRHPRLASMLIPFTADRAEVLGAFQTMLSWAAESGRPGERIGLLMERVGCESLLARLKRQ